MAINFSASFAACLAAGLKVPRQIMYCISQDTAPYVLYKDSQEAAERGTLGSSGQWGTDMYPSMQQSPQAHLANHHSSSQLPPPQQQQQQQQHPAPTSPRDDQQQQQNDQTQHGGNLPSPATSPYPQQQTNANQEMDDDVTSINQVSENKKAMMSWLGSTPSSLRHILPLKASSPIFAKFYFMYFLFG